MLLLQICHCLELSSHQILKDMICLSLNGINVRFKLPVATRESVAVHRKRQCFNDRRTRDCCRNILKCLRTH